MRRISMLAAGLIVALGLGSTPVASATPGCPRHVEATGLRLPAAVRVVTGCATYTLLPSGRVRAAVTPRLPDDGISWMLVAGAGSPVEQVGQGIAVLSHGRVVWRSRGRFRAAGVFAKVGKRGVAFSEESYGRCGERVSLYVARFGVAEQRVVTGERPLGWTARGDLLTWRFQRGLVGIYLRRPDGRLLRRVSGALRELRFDSATETAFAISRDGVLERYRAGGWSRIEDLNVLGLDRRASFERLSGGLIGILDGGQVVVLREDGSVFASAWFRFGNVAGQSGLVANRNGTAVAFVVTDAKPGARTGLESVELLHHGDRRGILRLRSRVSFASCVEWVTLAWRNGWLLDSVPGGRTLILATHSRTQLDLTPLLRELAPRSAPRSIGWT